MSAVAYSTLMLILVLTIISPIVHGQTSLARTTATPEASRTEFKRVLADQLAELRSQLLLLQRSSNQTVRGDMALSGTLNDVAQKVDAILLKAMPGFVGETIDIVQNSHPSSRLGSAFADASDFGLLASIRDSTERAKETMPSLPSNFLKSLGAIEQINYDLSPAARVSGSTKTYSGCRDAFLRGENKNGVYTMQIHRHPTFRAWCDFDDNEAWTVTMRRFDGNVDFCRSWNSYVNGFGSLWGEHWLGLRSIRQLSQGSVKLSMYMEDTDGRSHWMNYSSFYIAGADDNYRLTVSGFSGTTNYNALSGSNGYQFSTWDRGLDYYRGYTCSRSPCSSGWWYNHHDNISPTRIYEGSGLRIDCFMSVFAHINPSSAWYRLKSFVMRIGI